MQRNSRLITVVLSLLFCCACAQPEERIRPHYPYTEKTEEPADTTAAEPGPQDPGQQEPIPAVDPVDISLVFLESASSTSFKWPFAAPASNKISSTSSSPSYAGETVDFVLPESAGGYVFTLKTHGIAKNSSSSQGLKVNLSPDEYILLPAVEGLRLTTVTLVSGAAGWNGYPCIVDSTGTKVSCVRNQELFGVQGDSSTWFLSDTELNTPYRLSAETSGTVCIQQLLLHYGQTAAPVEGIPSEYIHEEGEDEIPDFSRVGYRYSDVPIPDYPVRMTLEAPADGADAMEMIQNAIKSVQTPGAILLKKGTYNISGTITLDRDGVVLRGEGEQTILYSTATTQIPTLIKLGPSTSRTLNNNSTTRIIMDRTPVGRMYVRVARPENFAVGDKVFIYRPGTDRWIQDLHMTEIPPRPDGGEVVQWKASGYNLYWERTVTAIDGDKVWLDNPVVMEMRDIYGGGYLMKGNWKRISESGVENLTLDTRYDASVKSGSDFTDEQHCWSAITVNSAEHCWVRGTVSHHFGFASVSLGGGAKHITVQGCKSYSPVSVVTGARRYAFVLNGGQMCLVRDCWCEQDRHQYVTGGRVCGPNVYLDCTAVKTRNDAGPHCYWSTGCLFDNVKTDGALNIQDRHWYGTGHGWTATAFVCWNCETKTICVQNPWVTGINWAVGCIGTKKAAARTYDDNLGPRPDGVWISPGVHVSPRSLFEDQLEKRHAEGIYFYR